MSTHRAVESARPRRLRVDVVASVGGYGGAERMVLELLDAEAARLDPHAIVMGRCGFLDQVVARGWPSHVQPTGPTPIDIARSTLRLAARWSSAPPDVALANGVKAAAVAVPAALIAGVPIVWLKHDFFHDQKLGRVLGHLATAVVANSVEVASATGRSDAVIIAPPRPSPALPVDEARRALASLGVETAAGPTVACIGRLVEYKGFGDLVEALSFPGAEMWTAVIFGDDDPAAPGERRRLEAIAAQVGVDDRVHFVGDVPNAGALLSGVDAVAIPTRIGEQGTVGEGYGIVADEALIGGVPVICTSSGPLGARLGDAAIPVAPRDPSAIASALANIATPERRHQLVTAGAEVASTLADARPGGALLVATLAEAAGRPGMALDPTTPISVVVPVFNEGTQVEALIARLAEQMHEDDELIVVDDGSSDDTPAVAQRAIDAGGIGGSVLRLQQNSGASRARNHGVGAARHEWIACTDAGCVPGTGWLQAMRAALGESSKPGLVSGVYRVGSQTRFDRASDVACFPEITEARRPDIVSRAYATLFGRSFRADLPSGRSVAFTRTAWRDAGRFPEELRTAEDIAFGQAVARSGHHAVLATDAVVTWPHRESVGATWRMYRRYGQGDGRSREPVVIARNLARVAAYLLGGATIVRGSRSSRAFAVLGAGAYLSIPIRRAKRRGLAPGDVALIPVAMAIKDLAKALGCAEGLARRGAR